jgi:hypothetical protein
LKNNRIYVPKIRIMMESSGILSGIQNRLDGIKCSEIKKENRNSCNSNNKCTFVLTDHSMKRRQTYLSKC